MALLLIGCGQTSEPVQACHVDDPSSIMFPDTHEDQRVTPAMKTILEDLFQ